LQYFGSSSSTNATSCAACDYYGTGQNNFFKYVAGLDPTDPTQVFTLQIAAVTNQSGQMNLTFRPVVGGRTYTVQSSLDLLSGYSDLISAGGTLTSGNQVTVTDTNAAPSNEFYRVRISFP
jgi:hypothetical protein